jgi:rRNA maturation protein Rpf1
MEFITTKELYDQALGLFQVEIRKAGRGHLVFVTDENGNPVRHPLRMSDFEERPRFYLLRQENLSQEQIRKSFSETSGSNKEGITASSLKSLIVKELIWQVQQQLNDGTLERIKRRTLKHQNKSRKKGRHF